MKNLDETLSSALDKYVETLQRSNEQLVKIASLMQKQKSSSFEFSSSDKDQLYDIINDKEKEEE